MRTLISCLLVMFLLAGCATSEMTSEKTLTDGTVIKYKVKISSLGQDFKGSDLEATLDPEGKTKVKAGAVDNTISQVTADVAKSMVEMVKALLPYIVIANPAPETP